MILGVHGLVASSISGFDADAQAFFDRVTTAGGSLSATEQTAVNTLVVQMKADGIWSKMAAIYPMVGASAAACAQNLKSSSFTGTFTSGWTFASSGVTPNGTSAYMDTGLVPSTNLGQDSQSLFVYSRSDIRNKEGWDMGANSTTPSSYRTNITFSWNDSKSYGLINNTTNLSANQSSTLGLFGISRTSSTSTKMYKNGTSIASSTAVSNGNVNRSIYLAFVNGETYLRYMNRQYALASISDGLSDTEASDFYTAVQAFQTTLSRQV